MARKRLPRNPYKEPWLKCPLCAYRCCGYALMARHLDRDHLYDFHCFCGWPEVPAGEYSIDKLAAHLKSVGSLKGHYVAHLLSKVEG